VITSCTKNNDVQPNVIATGKKQVDTISKSGLSLDDSIHLALFNVAPQKVYTSVSGKILTMKYDENVDLYMSAAGYQQTSSVHLLEDFSNTALKGFDFTTVAEGGNTTLDWVDDNLNNVILKTVTDTVINNYSVVKINVHRTFTFFNTYDSAQAATDEQNLLIGKTDDKITFTSYSYYNQKNYPKTNLTIGLVYSK
jgi:hypothetical protein